MPRQWATRVVVAFQSLCWCTAILLLLTRGLANLRSAAPQGSALGVGLIVLAVLMIVVSPVLLVARAYDRRNRRYASVDQMPDLGRPPAYEDIVSRAPSYTSLFDCEIPPLQLQCSSPEVKTHPQMTPE
ncbi:uncharacterized protein LOC129001706 [Macrosteles quadrilineatus]|uniref:uncharacterized protein LOC129001706 n=1 Tax=Macrosteles quadrilineatus TaxID=74068 RepID=UPI0023E0AC98|nr:uncharacterized protein LOC129001706 [Macrosteles quadrilineatus]